LAQVQIAIATWIERLGNGPEVSRARAYDDWRPVILCKAQIDLDRFDFRLGLRSLALSEL